MGKYIYVILALVSFSSLAQNKNSGFIKYKSECLGSELDGSYTLKAWGSGRNRSDAVEQAMKNAVHEIIFNGIPDGDKSCSRTGLVIDSSTEGKNQEYFFNFFADDGAYKDFVNLKDEKIGHKIKREKVKREVSITESAVVRVNRYKLKKKLIADNIIPNYIE
ncbi:MAG: hypothetical protein KA264_07635, partial [Crocinitomicaceae bacterium]|nr:hypothetical protein [Crocinitomicaceae bacterium]